MRTRTDLGWEHRPGGFDELHLSEEFGVPVSSNLFGIPSIRAQSTIPTTLVSFLNRRHVVGQPNTAIHFFVDDHKFSSLMRFPNRYAQDLARFPLVITPDYSVWEDSPEAANIWNTYRTRWHGAFWQARGLSVIPSVNWLTEAWDDVMFAGLPIGGVLAVSSPEWRDQPSVDAYVRGFAEMLHRCSPSDVLIYGSVAPVLIALANDANTKLHAYERD